MTGITLRSLGASIGSRVRFIEDTEGEWRTVETDEQLDYPHLLPWIVEKPKRCCPNCGVKI